MGKKKPKTVICSNVSIVGSINSQPVRPLVNLL